VTHQPSLRRAITDRPSRKAEIGAAVTAFVLAVAFFTPAMTAPGPSADASAARVTRVCPTTDAGAQVGVGSAGSGVAQAALTSPATTVAVASGDVLTLAKEPIRLSAPQTMAFWGVASASGAAGPDQGLSLAACQQPRAQHWITGVRSNTNAQADVILVNLDAADAAVNVSVWGADGPIAASGGRGVVVPGQSQKVLALGPLVNSPAPVTIQVGSSSGRVAVFVRQRLFDGATPLGADWITPGMEPATTLVVPAVPAGAGARTLILGNTGDRTAQVKVEVLGADGAYSLVGVEQVDVPAGATRTFALEQALAGKTASLRLTSTRDILGAVEAADVGDWATLDGVPALDGEAVASIPLPAGVTPVVTVANPSSASAHVVLTVADAAGKQLATKTVDVPASASVVVDPGVTALAVLKVASSEPSVRIAVAASGPVGTVAGLAWVPISDASSTFPTVTLTPEPRLGT
jgi:Family of unknown function (DUF5719)